MNDADFSSPLTDYAMNRLRAMAEGNGVDPQKIIVMSGDEKTYTLEGTMQLAPGCEVEARRYPEGVRGKPTQVLDSMAALNAESERRQKAFKERPDWIAAVKDELYKTPGKGWGLDGAKIILPERTVTLAAMETCTTCKGYKTVTCDQCQGQGGKICLQCRGQKHEFCHMCSGSGHNPHEPGQLCLICHGQRTIVCRTCRGQGQTACPTCRSKRVVVCTACGGSGHATEERILTFGATTQFLLKVTGLPSPMRRGLDRLGLPNLAKGHADIEIIVPPDEGEQEVIHDMHEMVREKPADPTLHFQATMPFADLRVDFGGKKAAIGVFGKKGVFIDIPPFLDDTLKPWREKLADARKGKASLDDVIEARAMRDAVTLNLQGKGNVKEFRRLYPVGISAAAVEEILRGTRQAIRRFTLKIRAFAAFGGCMLAAGIIAGSYMTPLPAQMARRLPYGYYILDFVPLLLAAGLGWALINSSTYFALKRRFPGTSLAVKQHAGHLGYVTLGAIAVIWLAILSFSTVRPPWLPSLFH